MNRGEEMGRPNSRRRRSPYPMCLLEVTRGGSSRDTLSLPLLVFFTTAQTSHHFIPLPAVIFSSGSLQLLL